MLPNSPDVEKAVFADEGILEELSKGQILIDMSSIAPLVSQSIARELATKGIDMLDAPVSGDRRRLSREPWPSWWEEGGDFQSL